MPTLPDAATIREFVIAGHADLGKVKQMLAAQPDLLDLSHEWQPGDRETAVQAAAHMGNRPIADYLLMQGAPLQICTAALLGNHESVERFLSADARQIHVLGAHGIPLLAHAALSGSVTLTALLIERGAQAGISFALGNAVTLGHVDLTRWLLAHTRPDLAWKNFQGKTPLEIALESNQAEIVELLQNHAVA